MLEDRLGHRFRDPTLLERALTRKAFALEARQRGEPCGDQEVFRTLGDAVLKAILVDLLVQAGAGSREEITRRKMALEREEQLAAMARDLGLGPALRLGAGEKRQGAAEEPYVLAESLEAVVGAIYLDGGFGAVRGAAVRWFGPRITGRGSRGPEGYAERNAPPGF
jgi:ribonuclease-3